MTTVDLTSYTMVEMAIFNTAGMAGTYAALNGSSSYAIFTGNGFPDDIKILKIYNDGTQGVTISLDGTTNHDYMPSKGTLIVDLQANHADTSSFGSGTMAVSVAANDTIGVYVDAGNVVGNAYTVYSIYKIGS